MDIEPGFYKGKLKGKTVLLMVYSEAPFLKVDMVEFWGGKNAICNHANDINVVKLGIEFVECIDNLTIEE
jgi:hypothetical protein